MDKKKIISALIAGFVFAFSVPVYGATSQPQLKPRVKIENATNYNTATVKKQANTQQTVTPKSTTTSTTRPAPPQREIKTYKDEQGNTISEEQKIRSKNLKKVYKGVTKDEHIMEALELLKGGLGEYSRRAILGNNLSEKPMQVDFEDLSKFGQAYTNFDALGWKKKERLYIYINKKHQDAPKPALAAVLAHEALHQDDFNSLNEETYAWTMEAAVWTQLSEKYPQYNNSTHPLAVRENTLKKLFIKGNYTSKYIRKTVMSNPGYSNLPSRSPGFEDDSL